MKMEDGEGSKRTEISEKGRRVVNVALGYMPSLLHWYTEYTGYATDFNS